MADDGYIFDNINLANGLLSNDSTIERTNEEYFYFDMDRNSSISRNSSSHLNDSSQIYYYNDYSNMACPKSYEPIPPDKILAFVLSGLAISLNVITLIAISQIKNRITTHHRLIISLCMSDTLIGVSVCLNNINQLVSPYDDESPPSCRLISMCIYLSTKALNSTGLNIGLLNLMLMAADHFIAIIRPLHYPLQMRTSRSTFVILIIWIIGILLGFSKFFTGYNANYRTGYYNYCEAVYLSLYNEEYTVFATAVLTSIIMVYIYIRIYIKIKRHRTPGESRQGSSGSSGGSGVQMGRSSSDIHRNKRALITTLLILGTFMICWMPTCVYEIALIIQLNINQEALHKHTHILIMFNRYLYNLLLLNSIADPIIYAVRMYDVQLGYKRLISKCCPCIKKDETCTTTYTWDRNPSRVNAGQHSMKQLRHNNGSFKNNITSNRLQGNEVKSSLKKKKCDAVVVQENNGNLSNKINRNCTYLMQKEKKSDDSGTFSEFSRPFSADF